MFEPVSRGRCPSTCTWSPPGRPGAGTARPMSCVNDIVGPYGVEQFEQAVAPGADHRQDLDRPGLDRRHLAAASPTMSAGPTTCSPARSPTAPTTRPRPAPPVSRAPRRRGSGTRCRSSRRQAGPPAGQHPAARRISCGGEERHAAAVSWIAPSGPDSEHPPASVHHGQAYVTALINAVMKSPDWNSTAIFLTWDDWGGFYDNVGPRRSTRTVTACGYRARHLPLRQAGLHRPPDLSSDAYLKFIEDDFLGGERLNPQTDGRPDRRPDVRETRRCWATWTRTSTSTRRPARRCCCRRTRRPTRRRFPPIHGRPACVGCTTPPGGLPPGSGA